MSKYIEKVEKTLNAAISKLEAEMDEARRNYNDTGYDRYFNKMSKCEVEIEEIKAYLKRDEAPVEKVTTEEYKEYMKMKQDLKAIKNKLFYLVADLGLPATANLVTMQDILRDY